MMRSGEETQMQVRTVEYFSTRFEAWNRKPYELLASLGLGGDQSSAFSAVPSDRTASTDYFPDRSEQLVGLEEARWTLTGLIMPVSSRRRSPGSPAEIKRP